MKRPNRFIRIVSVLAALLFAAASLSACGKEAVDTQAGLAVLEEMENRDLTAIEDKISSIRQKEYDDDEEAGERSYNDIFANALIMGDSIVESIWSYGHLESNCVIGEIGVNLLNLDNALSIATSLQPKTIILYYGFNDVANVGTDLDLFRRLYTDFLDELIAAVPGADIYIHSIFPNINAESAGGPLYEDLTPYNEVLKSIADEYGFPFLNNDDLIKEEYYEPDGYHFVSSFYPLWLNRLAHETGLIQ